MLQVAGRKRRRLAGTPRKGFTSGAAGGLHWLQCPTKRAETDCASHAAAAAGVVDPRRQECISSKGSISRSIIISSVSSSISSSSTGWRLRLQ